MRPFFGAAPAVSPIALFRSLAVLLALFAVAACGGGGGDDDSGDSEPQIISGVLLDSPVINIGYRTETQEGVTNARGEFNYVAGETVTFFIGDLVFPPVPASADDQVTTIGSLGGQTTFSVID